MPFDDIVAILVAVLLASRFVLENPVIGEGSLALHRPSVLEQIIFSGFAVLP
jgi:hypothetical protein